MKKNLALIIAPIIIAIVIYLLCSFVKMNTNPIYWSEEVRYIAVIVWIAISICTENEIKSINFK